MIARFLAMAMAMSVAFFVTETASAACASGATCSCNAVLTGVAFGSYDTQSSNPNDTVGNITISCMSSNDVGSTFAITMSPGSSGNANARKMLSGTHPLYYNLYINAARTMIWGDDSGGGQSVVSAFPVGSRSVRSFSIYGRVPALQNASVGNYRDNITVTVAF